MRAPQLCAPYATALAAPEAAKLKGKVKASVRPLRRLKRKKKKNQRSLSRNFYCILCAYVCLCVYMCNFVCVCTKCAHRCVRGSKEKKEKSPKSSKASLFSSPSLPPSLISLHSCGRLSHPFSFSTAPALHPLPRRPSAAGKREREDQTQKRRVPSATALSPCSSPHSLLNR